MTVLKNNNISWALIGLAFMVSAPALAGGLSPYQEADPKNAQKDNPLPSVGKAANIVPGPYMPKGTVKLPARPLASAAHQDSDVMPSTISGRGTLETPLKRDAVIEDALIQLDPSGIAASEEDALKPAIFWGSYNRKTIQGFISTLHPSGPLPTIHALAEDFVRLGQILPAPLEDDDVSQFIKVRISALRRFGNGSAYVSLINRLPKDRDWSQISRSIAEAALVSGKLVKACSIAAEQGNATSDLFWLKMNTLCYAMDGNRSGVDFQIGIMEEIASISPVFYKLTDQLLIEAEQSSARKDDQNLTGMTPLDIYEPFPVAILEASMARLTGARISDLAPEAPDPLALPMLISQPGLSREARIELVALGIKQNWLKPDLLKEFVKTLDISVDEEALAYRLYDSDDRFLIDLALARQMAKADNTLEDRMQAFKLGAERAARNNTTAGLAELHLSLIEDITPNKDLISYATTVGRLSLLTGNYDLAANWFSLARAHPAGNNAVSDKELITLWPLLVVAGKDDNLPAVNDATLWKWWSAMASDEDRFDKANRLFTVLEGLGYDVSETVWGWLEAGPSAVNGKAISPAHWRRFLIAYDQGQQIDIHLSLIPLFENDETIEPALLGSVIGYLHDYGEKQLARDIALESLLHAGL